MLRWNKKLNLTRIVEWGEAVRRHYAEGVFLSTVMGCGCRSVVDLGSGAGFPGYPVAVMCPNTQVSLLESDQRKAAFLREACGDRPNVRVVCQHSDLSAGEWDCTISRAVRISDVVPFALRVSHRVAVLVSAADSAEWLTDTTLSGARVSPLPWDPTACVITADVPRETSA